MQDWIVETVEGLAARRQRKAVDDELRLRHARWIEMTESEIWLDLRKQVERDVARYNQIRRAEDPPIDFGMLAFGFNVMTRYSPRIVLGVSAPGGLLRINYSHTATFNKERSWDRKLEVKFDRNGEDYFIECTGVAPIASERFDTIQAASRFLLRPLIDPDFQIPSDAEPSA